MFSPRVLLVVIVVAVAIMGTLTKAASIPDQDTSQFIRLSSRQLGKGSLNSPNEKPRKVNNKSSSSHTENSHPGNYTKPEKYQGDYMKASRGETMLSFSFVSWEQSKTKKHDE
ncbi:hypothetical protein IWQ62_003629 [Dispira parvispora]|uniref:Uncharacterized protein n=1 Tax=Dispira parvispora TaxID=1520584 RepID=A0A9W8ATS7_9FUNG|nr:hypothetical protein IWQ62_003629 [Dispira parvispora]